MDMLELNENMLERDKTEHMRFVLCLVHIMKKKSGAKCYSQFDFEMSGDSVLQEVGCNHAQSVGFSTDGFATTPTMRKLHLIWVTARMHIEVYKYPAWWVLFLYNTRFINSQFKNSNFK